MPGIEPTSGTLPLKQRKEGCVLVTPPRPRCNDSLCVADSEKTYKCDMVMLAMGFLGPEKDIVAELELKQDPRSNIQTPRGQYNSSIPKVYAAGGRPHPTKHNP